MEDNSEMIEGGAAKHGAAGGKQGHKPTAAAPRMPQNHGTVTKIAEAKADEAREVDTLSPVRRNDIRRETDQWAKDNLPQVVLPDGNKARRATVSMSNGNNVIVTRNSFGEIFSKNKANDNLPEIMAIARDYDSWIPTMEFVRTEDGLHYACKFNVYEVEISGKRYEVKTKILDNEYLHTIRQI